MAKRDWDGWAWRNTDGELLPETARIGKTKPRCPNPYKLATWGLGRWVKVRIVEVDDGEA